MSFIGDLEWESSEVDNEQTEMSEEGLHSVLMLEEADWEQQPETSANDLMLLLPHTHTENIPPYQLALPTSSTQLALPASQNTQENDVNMTVSVPHAMQVVSGE